MAVFLWQVQWSSLIFSFGPLRTVTVLHHHPPNASPKFASFHLNITNHRQQADTQIKEKRNRNKKMLLLNNRQRGAASAQNAVR